MKILILGSPGSIHTISWANELSREFEVYLAFFDGDERQHQIKQEWKDQSTGKYEFVILGKKPTIPIYRNLQYKLEMNPFFRWNGWRRRALLEFITAHDIDVIFAHALQYYAFLAVNNGRAPVISSAWGSEVLYSNSWFIKKRVAKVVKQSNYLICTSLEMEEKLRALRQNAPLLNFSWGVDLENFPDLTGEERKNILSKLGLGDNPTIIFPRGLKPVYRGDLQIDVIRKMSKMTDINLIIRVQDPVHQQIIDEIDFKSNIHIFKNVSKREFADMLRVSDICVSIPVSDQRSTTVIESLAAGNLLILSKLTAFHDLYSLDGVFEARLDVDGLFAQITGILNSLSDYQEARAINRAYAFEHESQKNIVRNFKKIVSEIL